MTDESVSGKEMKQYHSHAIGHGGEAAWLCKEIK